MTCNASLLHLVPLLLPSAYELGRDTKGSCLSYHFVFGFVQFVHIRPRLRRV